MREPTYVAQLAATLDELSDGRAEVVFGIGNIAMLEQYGVEWRGTRPIGRLREAHHVMRTVLDEGSIDFEGDFYSYSGVTTAARPVQEHLPLKIGAMGGPKSMELAGEIADGLHTACAYSPRRWATRSSTSRWGRTRRPKPGRPRSRRLPARGDRPGRRRCPPRGANPGGVLHPVDAARAARTSRDRAGTGRAGQRGLRRRATSKARSRRLRTRSPTGSSSPAPPRTGCGG